MASAQIRRGYFALVGSRFIQGSIRPMGMIQIVPAMA
jgi:hypothetical protein